MNLTPSTIKSLHNIKIRPHAGKNHQYFVLFICKHKITIALVTSILSASGSANLPNVVTKLYFLAILPSKKSVIEAMANIIILIKFAIDNPELNTVLLFK